jgi:uncharacterized membrane-anchored protein YjiN (DUF445 family)
MPDLVSAEAQAADAADAAPGARRALPVFRDEAERRLRLRQNRRRATGLLGVMAATYFATHAAEAPGYGLRLLRSAAEGGMVGGLADWFAITALFRRPLGLPIPHTAIVPRSKERIASALSRFIEENFLTRDVLLRRLRQARIGHRAAEWLSRPKTAQALAGWIVASLPPLIRALDSPELQAFAQRTLGRQIAGADIGPAIGRLVDAVATSGEADLIFENVLDLSADWLQRHRRDFYAIVHEGTRWWVPRAIDRRIAEAVVDGLTELIGKLRQPDSEARRKFRQAARDVAHGLVSSPERRAEVNAAKDRLLAHPDVRDWVASIWHGARDSALTELEAPSPRARRAIEGFIGSLARALAADEAVLAQIEAAVEHVCLTVVTHRGDVGAVLADIVRDWDAQSITDRLELTVGSDLQYVRMTGTIVGASVGASLFLLVSALGWLH